ncbi:MAG: methyltransferase domain-containing protein [Dongiaceae bacterium]
MSWSPAQYLKFSDHRFRPAIDLLGRIDAAQPRTVCDLGCGTGHLTLELKKRWPDAYVYGVDSSPDMLTKAREVAPALNFSLANAGDWRPDRPLDVIFGNAVLHWLPDHGNLFPRLLSLLAKDGVLAVQMPRNHESPSHRLMLKAAASERWESRLAGVQGINPVHEPAFYHRALTVEAREIDIWESEYLHVLTGPDPIVEWTKGTALRPYLDALEGADREAFTADYRHLVAKAYPPEPDGRTLFPFRRIFIVARRS